MHGSLVSIALAVSLHPWTDNTFETGLTEPKNQPWFNPLDWNAFAF